jgi:hypothetical protein
VWADLGCRRGRRIQNRLQGDWGAESLDPGRFLGLGQIPLQIDGFAYQGSHRRYLSRSVQIVEGERTLLYTLHYSGFIIDLQLSVLNKLPLGLFNYINRLFLGVESPFTGSDVHMTFTGPEADDSFTQFLQIEAVGQGLYTYGRNLEVRHDVLHFLRCRPCDRCRVCNTLSL